MSETVGAGLVHKTFSKEREREKDTSCLERKVRKRKEGSFKLSQTLNMRDIEYSKDFVWVIIIFGFLKYM